MDIIRSSLIIISLISFIYTISTTSINNHLASDFGIINLLPLSFWIGMFTIIILWFLSYESTTFLKASLFLTFTYIFVIPTIIYSPVYSSNSYYPYGEGLLVIENEHLIPRDLDILTSYHWWPMFLYLSGLIKLVSGIPDYYILKTFPLIIMALFSSITYLVLNMKLNEKDAIIGSAWVISSFWLRQNYFGPPGISYIYFVFLSLVLLWIYYKPETDTAGFMLTFLFMLTITALTHLLASLITIFILLALFVSDKILYKKSSNTLFLLLSASIIIVLLINTVFVPNGFQIFVIKSLLDSITGLTTSSLVNEASRIIGSDSMLYNYYSSWIIVGLNAIPSAILVIQTFLNFWKTKKIEIDSYLLSFLLFVILLGGFSISGTYGPHEAYQRGFMFGLIPISYFCVKTLKQHPKILTLTLGIIIILNIPAQYGADNFRLGLSTQLSGSEYFANHTPDSTKNLGMFSLYIRYYKPTKVFHYTAIGELPFTEYPLEEDVIQTIKESDYIILSDMMENYYKYFLGMNPVKDEYLYSHSRIFDNTAYQIFIP